VNPIRTVIAEDEAPARQWLRGLCSKHRDIRIVAECSTLSETSQALRSQETDLLLLDIHLGPHVGFRVLEGVPASAVPLVIVTTAHDQYAVKAFEKNAVDYLLKPVREERLALALERTRRRLNAGLTSEVRAEIRAALEPMQQLFQRGVSTGAPGRVIAEHNGSLHVLETSAIEMLETSGNYVILHANGGEYTLRATLQEMQESLPAKQFLRLNRSVIINVTFIERIDRDADGAHEFVLRAGRRVRVGRSYRNTIAELIRGQGLLPRQ